MHLERQKMHFATIMDNYLDLICLRQAVLVIVSTLVRKCAQIDVNCHIWLITVIIVKTNYWTEIIAKKNVNLLYLDRI